MIYQIKLCELLSLLQIFLHSVEQSTNFISRTQFETYPGFSLSTNEFNKFLTSTDIFLRENTKYSAQTKRVMMDNQEKTKLMIDIFTNEETNLQKSYRKIKEGFKNIISTNLIDTPSFTLYKGVKEQPFDINSQYLNLFINEINKEASLDLNGISSLIQVLNFPSSFSKINLNNPNTIINVYCEYNLLLLADRTTSIKPIESNDKSFNLFENTPFNLDSFLIENNLINRDKLLDTCSNVFEDLNEVNFNNQLLINKAFQNDPIKTSVDGFHFLAKNDKINCKIIVLEDDETNPDFNPNFLYIPIKRDLSIIPLLENSKTITNMDIYSYAVSLLLDSEETTDKLIVPTILKMMLEQKTLFIETSVEDIAENMFLFSDIETQRLKSNFLFVIDILLSKNYIFNRSYQNISLNTIRLLKSLNFHIGGVATVDLYFFTPLSGKTVFFNDNNQTIYNDNFEYENEKNQHFKLPGFSQLIQNSLQSYLEENFYNNSQVILNFYLIFKNHPLFREVLEIFFRKNYKNLDKDEIIDSLITGDNIYLRQFSIVFILNNEAYSWSKTKLSINSYFQAFYNSGLDVKNLKKYSIELHKIFEIKDVFLAKNNIKNFDTILEKIIKYRGVYTFEKDLYDDVSNQFFINLVQSDDFNINNCLQLSDRKLLNILQNENRENLENFVIQMANKYLNIDTNLFNFENINIIHSLVPEQSKNLINYIVKMNNKKFQNQEYFDFFISISATSVNFIVDNFPISLLSTPKNMKKILGSLIDNKKNAAVFYKKVSPEIYYHFLKNQENINDINQIVYNLLEQKTLSMGTVYHTNNYNNSKIGKTLKF